MPGKAISFTLILQNAPAGKMSTFVNSHLCDKRSHLEGGFHLSNVDDLPAVNKDEVNIPFRDNAAKIFSKSVNALQTLRKDDLPQTITSTQCNFG